MTTTAKKAALLLLLLGFIIGTSSCIMENRTVEFVVTDETCAEFSVDSPIANFTVPAEVNFSDEINRILEDNDVSREDISSVNLVSANYGVTSFSQTSEWTISGAVTVERLDTAEGPDTLISYTSQSVSDANGKQIPAPLDSAGVAVVNHAVMDVLSGNGNVILRFKLINSSVVPAPGVSNPIQFDWKACVKLDIVAKKDTDVPDPF